MRKQSEWLCFTATADYKYEVAAARAADCVLTGIHGSSLMRSSGLQPMYLMMIGSCQWSGWYRDEVLGSGNTSCLPLWHAKFIILCVLVYTQSLLEMSFHNRETKKQRLYVCFTFPLHRLKGILLLTSRNVYVYLDIKYLSRRLTSLNMSLFNHFNHIIFLLWKFTFMNTGIFRALSYKLLGVLLVHLRMLVFYTKEATSSWINLGILWFWEFFKCSEPANSYASLGYYFKSICVLHMRK